MSVLDDPVGRGSRSSPDGPARRAVGLKYTEGFTRALPSAITLTAMLLSIMLLSRALRTIPVGTGYAVWTGIGAVGTALVGSLVLGKQKDSGPFVTLNEVKGA